MVLVAANPPEDVQVTSATHYAGAWPAAGDFGNLLLFSLSQKWSDSVSNE